MATLRYRSTNENLQNIVDGLQPESGDVIAAICGSGDQAFALAEYGARVFAVDRNPEQVSFAEQRLHSLGTEKEEEIFFNRAYRGESGSLNFNVGRSNAYFSLGGRREKIRIHRANIHFRCDDFFSYVCENAGAIGFTKIYISNAISRLWGCKSPQKALDDIVNVLPKRGLLYVANGLYVTNGFIFSGFSPKALREVHPQLECVSVFQNSTGWEPAVFVKR
ncbi:hypothetical protein J4210_04820 [Candidatus Woesearchaeota archaeon]|nr:hypothetical protein [Candidatus Woesearchaeota archaeon]